MSCHSRISNAFKTAPILPLNCSSKYILMSDCHRGCGNANDNFLKNEFLYLAALNHYYRKGFTYLELGDGDELWENHSVRKIKEMHHRSFEMLGRFYKENRLYLLYGNHDMIKKQKHFPDKYFSAYYCEHAMCEILSLIHI